MTRLAHLTVREFYTRYGKSLHLSLAGPETGLERRITQPELNRSGLALAGFFTYFAEQRIQLIGNAEISYLNCLRKRDRLRRFSDLCWKSVPCIVLAQGHELDAELMAEAARAEVCIFHTTMRSMQFLNAATARLLWAFAPTTTEHGCMVDIRGIGVLIRGASGAGKSETVLGLLDHGASLVADDLVRLRHVEGGELVGTASDAGRHHMEVRGLGVINVLAIYGVAAIRIEKVLNLVVTLRSFADLNEVDRLGVDKKYYEILGLQLPLVEIPVAPGRNLAKLIEVAALDTKLKALGHNAAIKFNKRLIQQMRDHVDDE